MNHLSIKNNKKITAVFLVLFFLATGLYAQNNESTQITIENMDYDTINEELARYEEIIKRNEKILIDDYYAMKELEMPVKLSGFEDLKAKYQLLMFLFEKKIELQKAQSQSVEFRAAQLREKVKKIKKDNSNPGLFTPQNILTATGVVSLGLFTIIQSDVSGLRDKYDETTDTESAKELLQEIETGQTASLIWGVLAGITLSLSFTISLVKY